MIESTYVAYADFVPEQIVEVNIDLSRQYSRQRRYLHRGSCCRR